VTYEKHKEPNEIRCDLIERLEDYCRNMNKEDIISGLVNELTTDQCLSCMDNLERDIFWYSLFYSFFILLLKVFNYD